MNPDDHVCLCFRVSLRKLRTFMEREMPPVASRLSECLGAGTGCHWCVPFLEELHRQWRTGETPDLRVSPQAYAARRARYRATGRRDLDAGEPDPADDHRAEGSGRGPLPRPPAGELGTPPADQS